MVKNLESFWIFYFHLVVSPISSNPAAPWVLVQGNKLHQMPRPEYYCKRRPRDVMSKWLKIKVRYSQGHSCLTFISLKHFSKSFAFKSTRKCKSIVILIVCNFIKKPATVLMNLLQFILFHASESCNTWWVCVNNCIYIWICCIDWNMKINCSFLWLFCNYFRIFSFID